MTNRRWRSMSIAVAVAVALVLGSIGVADGLSTVQLVAVMLLAMVFGVWFRVYNRNRHQE